jgi:hypothetical protein
MKKGIWFLLLMSTITTNGQSLKDALYGGKLKSDTGSVIRKTDDLSQKIDTSSKKTIDSLKIKITAATRDSITKGLIVLSDSSLSKTNDVVDVKVELKDNNVILKEYMDSIISTFKTEVLPDKKIKNGNYFILVDYEIGIDGQLSVNKITPTPENSFLRDQIKERFDLTSPRMNPVLSNGKPRKVVRKFNFTLLKQ